jgi:SAM-dependent methyltransferase
MDTEFDTFGVFDTNAPVETVVEVLHGLSNGGSALELGVGTGRTALPLVAAGVHVTGIDSSAAMLEVLRAKPGGAELPVLLGNFRDLQGGPYHLIYSVCNAFCRLLEQDDQVACFANAGQALVEGGTFLLETALWPHRNDARMSVEETGEGRVVLRLGSYDGVQQVASAATVVFSGNQAQAYPNRTRYAAPAELDLMARLAGLTLRERWGDWEGNPVTSHSACAISLYELRTKAW